MSGHYLLSRRSRTITTSPTATTITRSPSRSGSLGRRGPRSTFVSASIARPPTTIPLSELSLKNRPTVLRRTCSLINTHALPHAHSQDLPSPSKGLLTDIVLSTIPIIHRRLHVLLQEVHSLPYLLDLSNRRDPDCVAEAAGIVGTTYE